MAKTNKILTCQACGNEVPPETNGVCFCGFVIESKKNPVFEGPMYLSIQNAEAMAELEHDAEGSLKTAKQQKVTNHLVSWLRNCSDEDRIAALEDAVFMLEHAIPASASIVAIKRMTNYGRQIGELSKTIEDYARNGGRFNAPEIPTAPEERGDKQSPQPTE